MNKYQAEYDQANRYSRKILDLIRIELGRGKIDFYITLETKDDLIYFKERIYFEISDIAYIGEFCFRIVKNKIRGDYKIDKLKTKKF